MNFFGHAVVATAYDARPEFVLGAMLPDFCGMLGLRAPDVLEAGVERGVALHHATDAAFHGIPAFVELMTRSREALARAGVARGPARAVAHIGTELLLDEALAHDAAAVASYVTALRRAGESPAALCWHEADADTRFRGLTRLLLDRAEKAPNGEPELIAQRLRRTLATRPRLAFSEADEARVREWVVAARPNVVGCAELIIVELRSRLAAVGYRLDASPRLPRAPDPSTR